jgi:hypothetical protein
MAHVMISSVGNNSGDVGRSMYFLEESLVNTAALLGLLMLLDLK